MKPIDASEPQATGRLRPPGLSLLLAEVRGIFEFNASLMLSPLLMGAPRGDGHPVLTLPGFLASDLSMAPMRRYLKELGYDAYAWNNGRNIGGVLRMRVVTLGSPFANDIRATNATRLYEALSGEAVEDNADLRTALAGDLPVPTTSIYSRTDGVVNWRTCLLRPSDTAENIEVYLASHIGLGVNAAALWAVADRLAQSEGQFRQFDRSGPFAIAYASPENAQS